MKPKLFVFALAAFALALTGAPNNAADTKADPADVTEEVPYEKLSAAGKNVVKLTTALKLKELGWGTDVKGGRPEGYSLEGLLAAARMLRELPKMDETDPKAVVVTAAPDAPKGDAPKPTAFDPIAESKVILDRVADISGTFEDADQKKAFATLIDQIKKIDNSKAVIGGPKVATRVIKPGEKHVFTFTVAVGLPSALAVTTNGPPIRFEMTNAVGGNVHFNQVVKFGAYTWTPRGNLGQTRDFKVEVTNPRKVAVTYTIAVE